MANQLEMNNRYIYCIYIYTFSFGRADVKPRLGIQRDGAGASNPLFPVPGRVLQAHQLQRERGFPSPQLLQLVGDRLGLLTAHKCERRGWVPVTVPDHPPPPPAGNCGGTTYHVAIEAAVERCGAPESFVSNSVPVWGQTKHFVCTLSPKLRIAVPTEISEGRRKPQTGDTPSASCVSSSVEKKGVRGQ